MTTSFGKWYGKNGADYNARRRKRYKEDQQYKAQVLGHVKDSRKRRVQAKNTWFIGEAAVQVGVSIQTLKEWEARGYFPRTSNASGYRIYTAEQIECLKHIAFYLMYASRAALPGNDPVTWNNWLAANNIKERWGWH